MYVDTTIMRVSWSTNASISIHETNFEQASRNETVNFIQERSYRVCDTNKYTDDIDPPLTITDSDTKKMPILPKNKTYNRYKKNLTQFILKPLVVKSQSLDVFMKKDDIYDIDEFSLINNLFTIKIQQQVHVVGDVAVILLLNHILNTINAFL